MTREPSICRDSYSLLMGISLVFETHSKTEDNELGRATGWLGGRLSEEGRVLAAELGARRRENSIDAMFSSDLARAVETSTIAFDGSGIPVLLDWRLRECDYGSLNGHPVAEVHSAVTTASDRFPAGESWEEAAMRVGRFLDDLALRWRDKRVLVIGHNATLIGIRHRCEGISVEDAWRNPVSWQLGWEFDLAV